MKYFYVLLIVLLSLLAVGDLRLNLVSFYSVRSTLPDMPVKLISKGPTPPSTLPFQKCYHQLPVHTIPDERLHILGFVAPATSCPNNCVVAP